VGSNSNENDCDFNPQVSPEMKPKIGQEFRTLDDVWTFYNAYAKESGFSVRNYSVKKDVETKEITRKKYICYKQGKGVVIASADTSGRRGSVRDDCNVNLVVVRSLSGTYVVRIFVESHSHPLATPLKTYFLRSHRSVSSARKCLTQQLGMIHIPPHQQFNFLGVQAGGFENIEFTQKDLYNLERDKRNELKGHDGDILH